MAKINSLSLEKIKKNSKFVEKKDGINIDRVIFPHDMQIGLADASFQSSLVVKGKITAPTLTLTGDATISGSSDPGGSISGSIHHTSEGLSYLVAGTNVTITSASNGQVTIASSGGGGGGSQNLFDTISVAGQSNIEADTTTDSLTFVAGTNMTITTNAGTDSVTFTAADHPTITGSFNVKYPADRPSTFVTTSSVAIVRR